MDAHYYIQTDFVRGLMFAGHLVVALFFLRFWRESRDRLFALFAVAFVILALRNVLRPFFSGNYEEALYPYALRLVGYVIILAAIVDKNLRKA
jgi:hypothetical protein